MSIVGLLKRIVFSVAPFWLLTQLCASEKILEARRVSPPPVLDGRLDETCWSLGKPASDFIQGWPNFGRPASLQTEAWVLFDDHYLYVGARMHHPSGQAQIVERVHRRDQDSTSDWFFVFIDSLRDKRNAFFFGVNAGGVQRDGLYHSDTTSDSSWDGVWESAISQDLDGWSAEMKIPLALLKFQNGGGVQTWGINFQRSDQVVRETSYWNQVPREENAFVSRFPQLKGMEGLKPRSRRELLPYLSFQRKFETAQNWDDRRWQFRAGLDGRIGLSNASQLDFSIYPDFGQVEVDDAVLNLGTYETYFPEKRPFFIEGMDVFQTPGLQLFYSRRIGKGVEEVSLSEGERLKDQPLSADILGAGKITSKNDNGLSMGLLGALTESARARVQLPNGMEEARILLPQTSFGVFRIQQRLDQNGSYVGGFASLMNQAGQSSQRGEVASVDGQWKSQDRSVVGTVLLAQSRAGLKGETHTGGYGRFQASKNWKNGWSVTGLALNAGRWFNPNDLGYLNRADERRGYVEFRKVQDNLQGPLKSTDLRLRWNESQDQAGHPFSRYAEVGLSTMFTNFWSLSGGFGGSQRVWDDRELRTFSDPEKKYLIRRPSRWAWLSSDTAGNRPWYLNLNLFREWTPYRPSESLTLFQAIRPSSRLEIKLNTSYLREQGDEKYLETQENGQPVLGLRSLSQFEQTLTLGYAFTPHLSLQLLSQWLDAAWSFQQLRTWVSPTTSTPWEPSIHRDFNTRLWNASLIARWEFRPGSTAYWVITHHSTSDGLLHERAALRPIKDLGALRHQPSDNALQFKLSWLLR